MGNYKSKVLVLQTGNLRTAAHPIINQDYLPKNVFHQWLPYSLEAKYEAEDFVKKFCLSGMDHFNIYDGNKHTVIIGQNENVPILLENVNIVVSCGSSSIQAFKITRIGAIPILPVTDEVMINLSVMGLKNKSTLDYRSTSRFGGDSNDKDIASDILNYINSNAFRYNEYGEKIKTNVIFVNQIGYSILGFNPKNNPVPSEQKIVSLRFYENFLDNEGKTSVVNLFKKVAQGIAMNNAFVVARQCKVYVGLREEELGGQWANQVHNIINERDLRLYNNINFKYVLDLGGESGTFYKKDENGLYKKYTNIKGFMKGEKSPNSFCLCQSDIDKFVYEFNDRFNEIKKLLK